MTRLKLVYSLLVKNYRLPFNLSLNQLDNNSVQIELTLISVVQGLALAELSSMAIPLWVNFEWYYWLYVLAGFLVILFFWAQAIIHALSFIRWPIDLVHNFLYFTVLLLEVLTFSQFTHPLRWFISNNLLFLIVGILYLFDLKLIEERKSDYDSPPKQRLYNHIIADQKKSLRYFIPLGLLYMPIASIVIWRYQNLFLTQGYHILLAFGYVFVSIIVLIRTLRNFKERIDLVTQVAKQT